MKKLILTGFMATGKSTVARHLARQLRWPIIDCDAEISALAGKPIHQIFRDSGEERFRALEREVISKITSDGRRCAQCGQPRPAVIATGGGAIVDPQNYAALHDCGVIICLTARPEVIARRIASGVKVRPILTESGVPIKQRIGELMEMRREAYARARFTVDTSERSVELVVNAILDVMAKDYPTIVHPSLEAPR
jgi:shikimate kinase